MDAQQFLAEFGHIANAPGGIVQLRALMLSLAMQGKIVEQNLTDPPASKLIEAIKADKKHLAKSGQLKESKTISAIDIQEAPYSLPVGWEWVRLGTIGHVFNGNSINSAEKTAQYMGGEGRPYIATKDVGYGLQRLNYDNGVRIPETELSFKVARKGAVLICAEGGSAGKKCGITETDICFGNKLFANELFGGIPSRFILYFYLSPVFRKLFETAMSGIIGGVSTARFIELPVPLPPLQEQIRIVAKVDELMGLCNTLESQQQECRKLQNVLRQSNLQAVSTANSPLELQTTWERLSDNFGQIFQKPEDFADLEQCVKQLALKGLLTNCEPGEQVSANLVDLASKSAAVVNESEMDWSIPDHWVWARSEWLGEARLGKMLDAAKNKGELRPYLRNVNVRWRKFDLTDILNMRVEEKELTRISVRKGDLVICEGGEPGRAAIWDMDGEFVIQKALHRYRCNEHVLPEYLLFCLEHDYFSGRLSRYYTGATIKHLTGRALAEYPIPLPPIDEQKRILVSAGNLIQIISTVKNRIHAGNNCAETLAIAAVASLTGIAIDKVEDEPVKAPQTELVATLRLGTHPDIKVQAPLATLLARHNGEMGANDLWQRFGGEIDVFYAQLKTEVTHGWILEPTVAEMREKITTAAGA
ncbi:MAG: restriction endonuclease subunit S [Desulfuromonadaceae bacterium]|nr:restriction endonuclease subunit S [Desulfuromonadaceae bacterium]